jgi:hypothetical protein
MPFRMKLITFDDEEIISPRIAPNNMKSKYGYNDRRIIKEINKTGNSMVKFKIIKSYELITED